MNGRHAAVQMLLLLVMMCAAACAQADTAMPARGIAVAAPENAQAGGAVPMYEKADEKSAVLMEYYSGTVLEVLRVENGMAWVQCGTKEASVMGYMRTQDLRYGAQALREVPRCYMNIQMVGEAAVQAYCDGQAAVLGGVDARYTLSTCGKNADKWVQIMRHPIERTGDWERMDVEHGFVHMITGLGKGYFIDEGESWLVLPVEGELSYEQARLRALEHALANPDMLAQVKEERRCREELETFWTDIRLSWNRGRGRAEWAVYFQAPDDYEQAFHVYMEADGTLIGIQASNG